LGTTIVVSGRDNVIQPFQEYFAIHPLNHILEVNPFFRRRSLYEKYSSGCFPFIGLRYEHICPNGDGSAQLNAFHTDLGQQYILKGGLKGVMMGGEKQQ